MCNNNLELRMYGLVPYQLMGIQQGIQYGHATDEFVHINPWKSIGIAAGVGMVIGLLISRR